MKITWIIGNGFDIQCGLRTKYSDFYQSKLFQGKLDSNTLYSSISKYLKDNKKAEINWADMETALGEFTKMNPDFPVVDLRDCIKELNADLQEYLTGVDDNIRDIDEQQQKAFVETITKYPESFCDRDRANYIQLLRDYKGSLSKLAVEVSFISFNYTSMFQKYWEGMGNPMSFEYENLSPVLRKERTCNVHGTLSSGIILGCDNANQYEHNSFSSLENYLEKPKTNAVAGYRYHEIAESIISNTDIFILYGSSIGETDETWWNQIAKRTIGKNNRRIVLLSHDESFDPVNIYSGFELREAKKTAFIKRVSELNDQDHNALENQIIATCDLKDIFAVRLG